MQSSGLYGHEFDWLMLTQHSDMLACVVTAPQQEDSTYSALQVLAARGAGLWRYGYTQSSIIGKKVGDVFPVHVAQAIEKAVDVVATFDQATWTEVDWAGDHLLCVCIPVRVNGRLTYIEINMIPNVVKRRGGGSDLSMKTMTMDRAVKERDFKRIRLIQDLMSGVTPDMLIRWFEDAGRSKEHKDWLLTMKSVLDEVLKQWQESSYQVESAEDSVHTVNFKDKDVPKERTEKHTAEQSFDAEWQEEWVKQRIDRFPHLTEREKEVLWHIVSGKRNREIAEALYISEHTVKNHISNIFSKLGIKDRMQLIALIYRA